MNVSLSKLLEQPHDPCCVLEGHLYINFTGKPNDSLSASNSLSPRNQTVILTYKAVDAATLTEVFPCFFLRCKANARVILAKTGHGPHSSKIVVLFYVLFILYCSMYCLCVNVYCHRVTTQLQLTNISSMYVSLYKHNTKFRVS